MLLVPTVAQRLARLANKPRLDPIWKVRLAAFVFLHDFGKANRGFRRRWRAGAPPEGHIAPAVALINSDRLRDKLLDALPFEDMLGWGADSDALLSILAHHGRPVKGSRRPHVS